jgi:hypothetical protein
MGQRQLGAVLITGLGLYVVLESLVYVVSYLGIIQAYPEGREHFTLYLISFVWLAGLGTLLIWLREPLVNRLFPADPAISLPNSKELAAALIAVLGVYFTATALENLVLTEAQRFIASAQFPYSTGTLLDSSNSDNVMRARVHWLARLVIGVGLMLGSQGIARLLAEFRSAGHAPTAAVETRSVQPTREDS